MASQDLSIEDRRDRLFYWNIKYIHPYFVPEEKPSSLKSALILFLFASLSAAAQLPINEEQFLARLKIEGSLPETILNSRSVVFYPYTFAEAELDKIQRAFQRAGIDAVAYFENDLVSTGRDASVALAEYLNRREIANLIYFRKQARYSIYITTYNRRANLVEADQPAWTYESPALDVLLQHVYRTTANAFQRENFLINDVPEKGFEISAINGRRNEFFAIDLKVDQLAVPKFGDEAMDAELAQIMQLYPFKYTLTEPGLSEAELRKQGFLFVLRFMHARNKVVRDVLGYQINRGQNAIVSIAYNDDQQQLKNFSINEVVYKFYFKHIESSNVFLGTKWDADPDWQQALKNQLYGFKSEFKLN